MTDTKLKVIISASTRDLKHSFHVFAACSTQWRTGPSGLIGMDYSAVMLVMKAMGIGKKKRNRNLLQIRDYERGALDAVTERVCSTRSRR